MAKTTELHLKYLPTDATESWVKEHFARGAPSLFKVKLSFDRESGDCKGFGWLTVKDAEDAKELVDNWNAEPNNKLGDRHVEISYSKEQPTSSSSTWKPRDEKCKAAGGDGFQCIFGYRCKRSDCTFNHPANWDPEKQKEAAAGGRLERECRFGLRCARADCFFQHPEGWAPKQVSSSRPMRDCNRGWNCTFRGCFFNHPDGRQIDEEDGKEIEVVSSAQGKSRKTDEKDASQATKSSEESTKKQKAAKSEDAWDTTSSEVPLWFDPSIKLETLYEDEDVIAISKPAGVLSHPSTGFWDKGTVAHALVNRVPAEMLQERANHGEQDSYIPKCIVHRLDAGTTGVMMIAKTKEAEKGLTAEMRSADEPGKGKDAAKVYVTLLYGHPGGSSRKACVTIDGAIGRDPDNPKLWAVTPDGKHAKSVVRVHAYNEKAKVSLATVEIFTGRTHQIRVHCTSVGAPVANDHQYAGTFRNSAVKEALGSLPWPEKKNRRPLLHAWALDVKHPEGKQLTIRAPLPSDMAAAVEQLWPNLSKDPEEWPGLPERLLPSGATTNKGEDAAKTTPKKKKRKSTSSQVVDESSPDPKEEQTKSSKKKKFKAGEASPQSAKTDAVDENVPKPDALTSPKKKKKTSIASGSAVEDTGVEKASTQSQQDDVQTSPKKKKKKLSTGGAASSKDPTEDAAEGKKASMPKTKKLKSSAATPDSSAKKKKKVSKSPKS
eukprot:TRINITY_DN11273_c0_g1_i1.p1 TRINITY_DN11273_c0_g1~~TRINITY_DN11273_c0_g1_i1.p1  ORF type:complete len:762 (-),score=194.10 TRINITY_DN11273_c0_g1_i1:104-2254(-)